MAFPGQNDNLYHPGTKGPEIGLKTAIPGKKESGPHFSTQPGNVIVQFLNPKPMQKYEKLWKNPEQIGYICIG